MTVREPRPLRPLDPIPDETATEAPSAPAPFPPYVSHLRPSIVLLVLAILLLGLGYPGAITFVAQHLEPATANGSLYSSNGTVYGSTLIAQNLSAPWLFWERPAPGDYNSFNGSPTLLGYSDPALVNETRSYMQQYGPYAVTAPVPALLVTISASGLDPDITPEAALVQIPRIAANSNLSVTELMALVNAHIVQPFAGFIGPAYVDVFQLDIALLHAEKRSL